MELFVYTLIILFLFSFVPLKGGPGASGRVLPPVTGRSRVRVAVSSHCIGEGKACHWHPSPDPAQSGSSLHWVRPFFSFVPLCFIVDLAGSIWDPMSFRIVLGARWWHTDPKQRNQQDLCLLCWCWCSTIEIRCIDSILLNFEVLCSY